MADPCVSTISPPKIKNKVIIGIIQYFFLFFKKFNNSMKVLIYNIISIDFSLNLVFVYFQTNKKNIFYLS